MPVNTSAIDSIINAYLRGAQLRGEREDRANQIKLQNEASIQRREKDFLDRQDEQRRLDMENKRWEAQNAMAQAAHKLQVANAKQQISEGIVRTGITPPGFTKTPVPGTEENVQANVAGFTDKLNSLMPMYTSLPTENRFQNPELGVDVQLPTPEKFADQQAEVQRRIQKPKIEAKRAEQLTAGQIAHQKMVDQAVIQDTLNEKEFNRRKVLADEKAKEDYKRAIEVARIRAASVKDPTERESMKPIDPEFVQQNYNKGVRLGMTRKEAYDAVNANGGIPNRKLSNAEVNDLTALSIIEESALEAQKAIEAAGGFDKVFSGNPFAGALKEVGAKASGTLDPKLEKVRSLLGKMATTAVHKEFGSAFTATEKGLITSYVAFPSFWQRPSAVKENLENAIREARSVRARIQTGTALENRNARRPGDIDPTAIRPRGAQ